MTTAAAADVLAALRAGVSRVADVLYGLDTDPTVLLAKDHTSLRGRSAAAARSLAAGVDDLWQRYPSLTSAVDAFEAAAKAGDGAAVDEAARTLPDVLADLERRAAEVVAEVGSLGAAWRDLLPRVDRATAALRRLGGRADELGLGDDPALDAARRLVDALADAVAADPLDADPAPAEAAVARAEQRLDDLTRRRTLLPAELADARATLDELERLLPEGARALAEARAKIANPAGLVEPLSPAVLDEGQRALRPWLERLARLAASDEWPAAAFGLDNWRRAAHEWLGRARAAVDANRAPGERRNQLRGLLEAYRAKAAATGWAEDEALDAAHDRARAALHAAPCDLAAAEAFVHQYVRLVNERGQHR